MQRGLPQHQERLCGLCMSGQGSVIGGGCVTATREIAIARRSGVVSGDTFLLLFCWFSTSGRRHTTRISPRGTHGLHSHASKLAFGSQSHHAGNRRNIILCAGWMKTTTRQQKCGKTGCFEDIDAGQSSCIRYPASATGTPRHDWMPINDSCRIR
ncbi:hypothetical protein EDC01DRAFT_410878 [Geopyxis carbonaria]|nr:hypothetical protein EDC01DRAFT_410878 [Geopyxis carbonaria]